MAANGANATGAAAALTGAPAAVFTSAQPANTTSLEAAKTKVAAEKTKLIELKDALNKKIGEYKAISPDDNATMQAKTADIESTVTSLIQTFVALKASILEFVNLKFQDLDKQKASGDKYKALFTSALGIISKISDGVVQISSGVGEISDKVTGQVRSS